MEQFNTIQENVKKEIIVRFSIKLKEKKAMDKAKKEQLLALERVRQMNDEKLRLEKQEREAKIKADTFKRQQFIKKIDSVCNKMKRRLKRAHFTTLYTYYMILDEHMKVLRKRTDMSMKEKIVTFMKKYTKNKKIKREAKAFLANRVREDLYLVRHLS